MNKLIKSKKTTSLDALSEDLPQDELSIEDLDSVVDNVGFGNKNSAAEESASEALPKEIDKENQSSVSEDILLNYSGRDVKVRLVKIEPHLIDPEYLGNTRDVVESELDELKELIEQTKGNTEPVTLRPHPNPRSHFRYQTIAGKRRTLSCKSKDFPVLAKLGDFSDHDADLIAAIENAGRQDLDEFERADSLHRLVETLNMPVKKAIEIYNGSSQKKMGRTQFYKAIKGHSIPKSIRAHLADKRTVSQNKVAQMSDLFVLLKDSLGEVVLLDELGIPGDKFSSAELIIRLQDLHKEKGGDNEDESVYSEIVGQEILSGDGKKVATVALGSSGSPVMRFTREVSSDQVMKIVEFSRNLVQVKEN